MHRVKQHKLIDRVQVDLHHVELLQGKLEHGDLDEGNVGQDLHQDLLVLLN